MLVPLDTGDRQVYNYTGMALPREVESTLALGPKFGLPLTPDEVHVPTIVKDLEYCISSQPIGEEDKNLIRGKAVNIFTNFLNSYQTPKQYRILLNKVTATRQFLNANPHVLVGKSD